MSLFGALNTSVSGLSAQSAAFGNISDNVANSQTVGFKAVNTNFIDYLTTSTAQQNEPGAVVTRPSYTNNVQGTITQSSDPTALAISGQGFFAVSKQNGTVAGSNDPTFNPQTYYTDAAISSRTPMAIWSTAPANTCRAGPSMLLPGPPTSHSSRRSRSPRPDSTRSPRHK
jgi:flagellar basal body rod protein FlgB